MMFLLTTLNSLKLSDFQESKQISFIILHTFTSAKLVLLQHLQLSPAMFVHFNHGFLFNKQCFCDNVYCVQVWTEAATSSDICGPYSEPNHHRRRVQSFQERLSIVTDEVWISATLGPHTSNSREPAGETQQPNSRYLDSDSGAVCILIGSINSSLTLERGAGNRVWKGCQMQKTPCLQA